MPHSTDTVVPFSQKSAERDPLTGLAAYETFSSRCREAIEYAEAQNRIAAIHLVRIGNVRDVIIESGPHYGEEYLRKLALRLYGMLSADKLLARLRGETFGLLQGGLKGDGPALYITRRVCECLEAPFEVMDQNVEAAVHIGTALYRGADGETYEDVISAAWLALDEARQKPAGSCVVYGEKD